MRFLSVYAISILLLFAVKVDAQNVEVRGSLRGWVRGFTRSPNKIDLAESKLKLELLSTSGENIAFLTRCYFTHNGSDNQDIEIDFKQAYIDYYSDRLSFRIGRQIITWGKADEISPTDILNPQDLSNILEDKIIRKIGLFAVKLDWYFHDFELETVWKPEFKPMELPASDSKWNFKPAGIPEAPRLYPSNLEIGQTDLALKVSRTFSNFDLALSYFIGLDHLETNEIVYDSNTDQYRLIQQNYYRTEMLGAAFAGSIGSVGIWGETAYFLTKDDEGRDPLIKNPYLQCVIGSDYTFTNGIKVNAQYIQEFITRIDSGAERDMEEANFSRLGIVMPLQQALTTRIGKSFGSGEAHSIEFFMIYDLKDDGFLLSPKLVFSPEDALVFEVGTALFGGDNNSLFGRFSANDVVYLKCTFSF